MTIILFLLDTSGSMNQRTYTGTTLLDVAKGAVELFMKVSEPRFLAYLARHNRMNKIPVSVRPSVR